MRLEPYHAISALSEAIKAIASANWEHSTRPDKDIEWAKVKIAEANRLLNKIGKAS